MRKTFAEYYKPDEKRMKQLWKQGIFVPDTSVLLNLYKYSQATTGDILDVFKKIEERMWIPHQVGLEYHRNRTGVIKRELKSYDALKKDMDAMFKGVKAAVSSDRHPFLRNADIVEKSLSETFHAICSEIDERRTEYAELLNSDYIRVEIERLFDGRSGKPYSQEKLIGVYEQGEKRYKYFIPPGYADAGIKDCARDYGDWVLWSQVIDHATESKKPVILICDDTKEDWWLREDGQTLGPRPELAQELKEKADVDFYMYRCDPFLNL